MRGTETQDALATGELVVRLVGTEDFGLRREIGRAQFVGGRNYSRLIFDVVDLQEVVIGTRGGDLCIPPVFGVWPAGLCDAETGIIGFSLTAGRFDGDLQSGKWNFRPIEATVRAVIPGRVFDTYRYVRLPLILGASLDVGDAEVIPRLVGGFDFFGRTPGSRFEVGLTFRARPSLSDPRHDIIAEGVARLTTRWIAPWATAFSLHALHLDLGYAFSSRPGVTIGEHLSRTDRYSLWLVLQVEFTVQGSISFGHG